MIQKKADCVIQLANHYIPLSFRFPETVDLFSQYICNQESDFSRQELLIKSCSPLYVDDTLWNLLSDIEREKYPGPWTEFYQLTGLVSRYLLNFKACCFHSVAILWKGYVWLLCAPSGTGKTTQLHHWLNILGDDMHLISGDKPIIANEADGEIIVYSSPWNGKEQLIGSGSGLLGGLIYLEQANHNEITKINPREMVFPLFDEFLFYADFEEEIRAVGYLEDVLLRNYPVWKLKNVGDEASARLTINTLLAHINKN